MENEVYKRWKMLGLVEGLSEKDGIELANRYEELANYLINSTKNSKIVSSDGDSVSVLAFPILRRAFQNGGLNEKYSPVALCDKLINEFKKESDSLKSKMIGKGDATAEACAKFADYFSKNNKNNKPRL